MKNPFTRPAVNPADTHPTDGHFVLLVLADGTEHEGWWDKHCGWYFRGTREPHAKIVGWKEPEKPIT